MLTGLALLGVYINSLVESNAQSTAEAIELLNSFYTADTGAQLYMNELFPPNGVGGGSAFCAASSPVTFPFGIEGRGLNSCSAIVSCAEASVDVDGDGANESYFTIQSAGSCGDLTRTIQIRAQ
ncbi:MAG: MSHA biogenesis protein MshP [Pseudohongiellaceae bacterium]